MRKFATYRQFRLYPQKDAHKNQLQGKCNTKYRISQKTKTIYSIKENKKILILAEISGFHPILLLYRSFKKMP
jgi:hypothetical protein